MNKYVTAFLVVCGLGAVSLVSNIAISLGAIVEKPWPVYIYRCTVQRQVIECAIVPADMVPPLPSLKTPEPKKLPPKKIYV